MHIKTKLLSVVLLGIFVLGVAPANASSSSASFAAQITGTNLISFGNPSPLLTLDGSTNNYIDQSAFSPNTSTSVSALELSVSGSATSFGNNEFASAYAQAYQYFTLTPNSLLRLTITGNSSQSEYDGNSYASSYAGGFFNFYDSSGSTSGNKNFISDGASHTVTLSILSDDEPISGYFGVYGNAEARNVTPVPEPEQWMMMLVGLSLVSLQTIKAKQANRLGFAA